MSRLSIFRAINTERQRQAAKFPNQEPFKVEDHEKLNILVEEWLEMLEELTDAMLKTVRRVNDKAELSDLRKDLLETATVAVKWLEVLEPETISEPELSYTDLEEIWTKRIENLGPVGIYGPTEEGIIGKAQVA